LVDFKTGSGRWGWDMWAPDSRCLFPFAFGHLINGQKGKN